MNFGLGSLLMFARLIYEPSVSFIRKTSLNPQRLARCRHHIAVGVEVGAHTAGELHGDVLQVADGAEGQQDPLRPGVLGHAQDVGQALELVHRAGQAHDARNHGRGR